MRVTRLLLHCLFASCLATLAWPIHAQDKEDRVAFVIGNAAYSGSNKLINPVNDAKAVSSALRDQGFDVSEFTDLGKQQVNELRQQIEKRVKRNTVLFFYYAGHGVQVEGRNYLVPVDARFSNGNDLADESLYLGDVLAAIEKRRPRLSVVILDACRDNPFAHEKSNATKKGLARVDPPSSTVVFYATRPGGIASDGTEGNGLFTQSLLREFKSPQTPLEVVFRRVSTAVYKSSRGEQEPWIEGVIREEFSFFKDHSVETAILTPTAAPSLALPHQTSSNDSPSVTLPANTSTGSLLPEKKEPILASLSEDEVKVRVRSISKSEDEDLPTRVICDESGCFDYAKWAARLNQPERLDALKNSLRGLSDQIEANICVFNTEDFNCPNNDPIKMTVIYPLAPILPAKKAKGFSWNEAQVTSSGGVSFKSLPLVERGGTPGGCIPADGSLQFARDRVEIGISRMTCFNIIVPGSVKQSIQVLLMDLHRREMIAYWNWSVISFLTYGSGRHLVKIKF